MISKFDLTLSVRRQSKDCTVAWSTTLIYLRLRRSRACWVTGRPCWKGSCTHPQAHVSDLPVLTEAEREQLLVQWNATQVDYPQDLCVHQLFEQQVERTPDAVALVFEDQNSHLH